MMTITSVRVTTLGIMFAIASIPVLAQSQTPESYVARVGGDARIVPAGLLRLDGKAAICGQRPTVLDPSLDDYSATYPGFIVLNPRRLGTVSLPIKMWIHGQACGYHFRGPDGAQADCFAVQRGRQQGWLSEAGLDDVCTFISPTLGSKEHRPGPERCTAMRACFAAPPKAP